MAYVHTKLIQGYNKQRGVNKIQKNKYASK